jgi:hypothetical protein
VVAVLPPVAPNDLNGAIVPLEGKLKPDNIVTGSDLMKHPAVVVGLDRGLVEHLVYLPEEAGRRFSLGICLYG